MNEAKLEFLRRGGGGVYKTKHLPWGEYGYFLVLYIATETNQLHKIKLKTSLTRIRYYKQQNKQTKKKANL